MSQTQHSDFVIKGLFPAEKCVIFHLCESNRVKNNSFKGCSVNMNQELHLKWANYGLFFVFFR